MRVVDVSDMGEASQWRSPNRDKRQGEAAPHQNFAPHNKKCDVGEMCELGERSHKSVCDGVCESVRVVLVRFLDRGDV